MIQLLLGAFLVLILLPVHAQEEGPVLKGHLEERAHISVDKLEGQVLDSDTGAPIPDADVSLPDQGFSMKTDRDGRYHIPRFLGKNALIMTIKKPGYAPLSASIHENAPPLFNIHLEKQKRILILDDMLHHLGDGGYSEQSNNASAFRKRSEGPRLQRSFALNGASLSKTPYVQIGSIIGIDTPMAHFLSGNAIGAQASPMVVRLNGTPIAQIQVNGDNQKVQLPLSLLRLNGDNLFELETGYRVVTDENRIDYDDMELANVVLYL